VDRVRGLALLAGGCALAAAAAGTGPYLQKHGPGAFPLTRQQQNPNLREGLTVTEDGLDVGKPLELVDLGLAVVFALVIAGVVLFLAYRFVLFLARLRRLRMSRSEGRVGTAAYDPGEESSEDAVTALRRRVADELTVLSADLDQADDAREAVVACYVRMERAFAEAGAARLATESPLELMARVLDELYVPEADVRRLTGLFTEARFSAHPVTDEMREAARRSLRNVADALAVRA
jgi:hypothetical protein